MKRVITVLGLSVALVLSASMTAEAQSKKKGKEPELAISKRGNLLMEDDFSEKDLLWQFNKKECEYRIIKGSLATKSECARDSRSALTRQFTPADNVVVELRAILPTSASINVAVTHKGATFIVAGIVVPNEKSFYLNTWTASGATPADRNKKVSLGHLLYAKPRWVSVLFEAIEGNYALTVDGRTVRWEQVPYEKSERSLIQIIPGKPASNEVLAIDDVKVWEALPKDEGEDKDEKGKKKK
ncbi:MAG: hypothetical protein AB1696_23575 [Planctomycetota bacterium]